MILPEFSSAQTFSPEVLARWLAACGDGTKIFRGCRLSGPERIRIGCYSQIDEGVLIFSGAGVVIGSHVHLAFGSSISGGGQCVIHDFVGIGASVRLLTGTDLADGSGLTNPTVPGPLRSVHRGRVEVGAHAVVFTNTVVFPDVTIGEGAVVAAGSVVHRDLQSWSIYGGNPLVKIGVRPKERILQLASELLQSEGRSKQEEQSGMSSLGG